MCQICAAVPSHPTECHFINDGVDEEEVPVSADLPGDSTTGASVAIGATFDGEFETTGDWDWIEVELVAGQTYEITLDGHGSNPNDNPYLTVYAPGATTFSDATTVASDSNGAAGSVATVTFTATETGTYYIEAWDAYEDAGGYQISVNTASAEMLEEWSDEEIATQLTEGYWGGTARSWDTRTDNIITYNVSSLSPEYQALAAQAFKVWSDIADIRFVSTSGSADITFQDTASGAWASSSLSSVGGKLYITSSTINIQQNWANDDYTLQTFIHEIGHALGLGHAGGYNGSATYSQFNTGDADYLNDSWQVSVMSYFSQSENTYTDASFAYLLTPMMADILAIVDLYGAAQNTNLGATTYGYGNNSGEANFNASVLDDNGTNYALTIVDHGGIDTINLIQSTDDNKIDLTPGSFSDTGGLKGNLGIGSSTIIENANGGSGDDTIFGNDAANRLVGNGGADHINGRHGHDTIFGGAGNDRLYGWTGNDRLVAGSGNDMLYGGGGNDILIGNSGNNRINGVGGNDRLVAGTGVDIMDGGAGNDVYVFGGNFARDVIRDFEATNNAEKIDLSRISTITDWSDLSDNHMKQNGAHTVINAGGGNIIVLRDVNIDDLHQEDFLF